MTKDDVHHVALSAELSDAGRSTAVEVRFFGGQRIGEAAIQLVSAAADQGEAFGSFNGITLRAHRGTTVTEIVEGFARETAERCEAYRKSPEGIRATQEREDRRATMQAKHDALMKRLPALNMANAQDVLDWLCEMQEPSDHVGVLIARQTIVLAFERAGYVAGENCGKDYRPGDRNNTFRYLVGQALSGLKDGPSIHQIIHKFADQWRAQFAKATSAAQ